ncbi:hypothetical protein U9M48_019829, partial [Paspalum notatum var. saurae]
DMVSFVAHDFVRKAKLSSQEISQLVKVSSLGADQVKVVVATQNSCLFVLPDQVKVVVVFWLWNFWPGIALHSFRSSFLRFYEEGSPVDRPDSLSYKLCLSSSSEAEASHSEREGRHSVFIEENLPLISVASTMSVPHSEDRESQDTSGNSSTDKTTHKVLLTEIHKLKKRARAFTGAFVGMVSPVLLAIVLKKTKLKGVGKYQGTRVLEGFVNSVQGVFLHLAAVTLQMGMMPFLCAMISEGCATFLSRHHTYIAKRVLTASKMAVFFSNILLMFLGCSVLVVIHTKNAWFSLLVVCVCFMVAAFAILLHIGCCFWWYRYRSPDQKNNAAGGNDANKDYHSKLDHLLEFSAGITAMMFMVLESVVLEGLLRSSQLPPPLPPAPAPVTMTTKETGTFLAASLLVSFFTSAFAALLMNVWTIPLVVLTGTCVLGFNIALAILATVVVILVTWEELQLIAFGTLLPPFLVLLRLLARFTVKSIKNNGKEEVEASVPRPGGQTVQPPPRPEETNTTAPPDAQTQGQQEQQQQPPTAPPDAPTKGQLEPTPDEEETKPAPLELTKVTFTGFLAVAVPGVTTASPGIANTVFVGCAAASVLSGILWRLLTHAEAPSQDVREAVNLSSFSALACLFCAGIAFWVMAANAPN